MAHKYRNDIESFAERVLSLKFEDMWLLATYLEQLSDGEHEKDAEFFAHALLNYAKDVEEAYQDREA